MNLYAIATEDRKYVKIGVAKDVWDRLQKLQVGCPLALEVVGYWPGEAKEEPVVHQQLRRCHRRGEWFEYAGEAAAFVATSPPVQPKAIVKKAPQFGRKIGWRIERDTAVWREVKAIAKKSKSIVPAYLLLKKVREAHPHVTRAALGRLLSSKGVRYVNTARDGLYSGEYRAEEILAAG